MIPVFSPKNTLSDTILVECDFIQNFLINETSKYLTQSF